jgi:hypothetical protein
MTCKLKKTKKKNLFSESIPKIEIQRNKQTTKQTTNQTDLRVNVMLITMDLPANIFATRVLVSMKQTVMELGIINFD